MNISRFHFNSILIGLLLVLTLALALLYLTQPPIKLTNQGTHSTYQKIDQKIATLEALFTREQAQSDFQKNKLAERIIQLNELLEERTDQLAASQENTQKTRRLLISEQVITEQLSKQLNGEKARTRDHETNLTSNSAQILMLEKTLQQEKDYVLRLQAEFEAEKMQLLAVREELDLKKRELVRFKRNLTTSNRTLTAKKRELSISQVKINDFKRKNDSLNRKILILNSESTTLRQTSQRETIASSPNS
jgi:chromosome segregation ATPase